jgi:hypothetical protein
MVEFDAVFARAYSVDISSVSHDTPSASHPVHAERVSDPRPQGTIQRHKTKFRTVFVHRTVHERPIPDFGTASWSALGAARPQDRRLMRARDLRRFAIHVANRAEAPRCLVLAVIDRDHHRAR